MSEFKFACPVCGQHITADSSSSGTQLDCPTCFQKIVVPPAPLADSKFILSAARTKKRSRFSGNREPGAPRVSPAELLIGAALLLVIIACSAVIYHYAPQVAGWVRHWRGSRTVSVEAAAQTSAPPVVVTWTTDPAQASIPDQPAHGHLVGRPFTGDHASVFGATLLLRQGTAWPPDRALALALPFKNAEDLSGRTIVISPALATPVPRVTLGWKDDQQRRQRLEFTNRYTLNIVFGSAAGGRLPGKLYIALPDESKSVVAGTFDAEIRSEQKK